MESTKGKLAKRINTSYFYFALMRLVIFIILCTTGRLSLAQLPNYEIINYTIEDGLPSNECHEVLQDSKGYIWIATDRGLVRFDGYEFKTYGPRQGLRDISCLDFAMDSKDNIYLNTYTGDIFAYIQELDSIVTFQYSSGDLPSLTKFGNYFNDILLDSLDNIYLVAHAIGIFKVSKDGSIERISEELEYWSYVSIELEDAFMSYYQTLNKNEQWIKREYINIQAQTFERFKIHIDNKILDPIYRPSKTPSRIDLSFGYRIANDTVLFSTQGVHYFIDSSGVMFHRFDYDIVDIQVLNNGAIATALSYPGGLRIYKGNQALVSNNYHQLLEDKYCTSVIKLMDGSLFVSTLSNGCYLLRPKEFVHVGNYDFLEKEESIQSIALDSDNQLCVLTNRSKILEFNIESNALTYEFEDVATMHELYYDPEKDVLIVAGNKSRIRIKNGDYLPYQLRNSEGVFDVHMKKVKKVSADLTALIAAGYYYVIDDINEPVIEDYDRCFFDFRVNEVSFNEYCADYVGGYDGLYKLVSDSLVPVDKIPALHGVRVTSIEKTSGKMLLGTLGKGVFIIDENFGYTQLTTDDGLVSNNIESIYVSSTNIIFIMSKVGASLFKFAGGEFKLITNITRANGLPSNSVVDVVEDDKGGYFIATEKGVVQWSGTYPNENTKEPLIEKIMVNGKRSFENSFNYSQNNVTIHYKCIDYNSIGNIKYRYRLNNSDWQENPNSNVSFSNLQSGEYKFEVQSAYSNVGWSDSSAYQFEIHPPWWETFWFYSFTALGLLGASLIIYKKRTNQLRRDLEVQREINDLERSALQAQMNPHFIFNCLNSIQNFIMDNNKNLAMDYLSKFAKLIRQNLNASVENKVSLEEEVSMLDNYLSLEKLRFKNKFDYSITVDKKLNESRVFIPPLMVQPFVENAIVHGMKNIDEGGRISVFFNSDNSNLIVSIKDNGEGLKNDSDQLKERKSLGMSITKKRLSYANSWDKSNLDVQHSDSGTTVTVRIETIQKQELHTKG